MWYDSIQKKQKKKNSRCVACTASTDYLPQEAGLCRLCENWKEKRESARQKLVYFAPCLCCQLNLPAHRDRVVFTSCLKKFNNQRKLQPEPEVSRVVQELRVGLSMIILMISFIFKNRFSFRIFNQSGSIINCESLTLYIEDLRAACTIGAVHVL